MVNMAGLYRNEKLGEGKPMSWRRRDQVEKSQDASMDYITGICNAESMEFLLDLAIIGRGNVVCM